MAREGRAIAPQRADQGGAKRAGAGSEDAVARSSSLRARAAPQAKGSAFVLCSRLAPPGPFELALTDAETLVQWACRSPLTFSRSAGAFR